MAAPPVKVPANMHQVVVQGHTFTVDTRFELSSAKILGRGSFGVVTTAVDSKSGETIAIKRIRPYCNDEWDARHTLREVRLMKLLGDHPNVISLYSLSLFDEKAELYMMMELMDCDLHRIIQSKQPLSDAHFKCFAKQMLEGIKAMHLVGVFHRDLKPGNILVSKDCQLRITDFGLARYMDDVTLAGQNRENPMTEYVVTRWYRCPELLLAPTRPYSEAVDMWSLGCILGELIRRKPLFPGKSHANQVQLIFELKGYRGSQEDLGFPLSSEALAFLDRKCRGAAHPLSGMIPTAPSAALALLDSMISMDPNNRPSAAKALKVPYLSDATTTCDYTNVEKRIKKPSKTFFDFENQKYSLEALRQMIREEVFSNPAVSGSSSSSNVKQGMHRVTTDSTPRAGYHGSSQPNTGVPASYVEAPTSQMTTQPRGRNPSAFESNGSGKQQQDNYQQSSSQKAALLRSQSGVGVGDRQVANISSTSGLARHNSRDGDLSDNQRYTDLINARNASNGGKLQSLKPMPLRGISGNGEPINKAALGNSGALARSQGRTGQATTLSARGPVTGNQTKLPSLPMR